MKYHIVDEVVDVIYAGELIVPRGRADQLEVCETEVEGVGDWCEEQDDEQYRRRCEQRDAAPVKSLSV